MNVAARVYGSFSFLGIYCNYITLIINTFSVKCQVEFLYPLIIKRLQSQDASFVFSYISSGTNLFITNSKFLITSYDVQGSSSTSFEISFSSYFIAKFHS